MRLSYPMERALLNIADGVPSAYGLTGRSVLGAHPQTTIGLRDRGLITVRAGYGFELTDAGREMVRKLRPPNAHGLRTEPAAGEGTQHRVVRVPLFQKYSEVTSSIREPASERIISSFLW